MTRITWSGPKGKNADYELTISGHELTMNEPVDTTEAADINAASNLITLFANRIALYRGGRAIKWTKFSRHHKEEGMEFSHTFADGTEILIRLFDDEIQVYASNTLSFTRDGEKITLFINKKF